MARTVIEYDRHTNMFSPYLLRLPDAVLRHRDCPQPPRPERRRLEVVPEVSNIEPVHSLSTAPRESTRQRDFQLVCLTSDQGPAESLLLDSSEHASTSSPYLQLRPGLHATLREWTFPFFTKKVGHQLQREVFVSALLLEAAVGRESVQLTSNLSLPKKVCSSPASLRTTIQGNPNCK